jgi:hypothetical protein
MADRKISELNQASRVWDADLMVVVTGVGQTLPNTDTPVEKVTAKFPLSGLATWIFKVNEVVSGVSGIRVTPVIGTGANPLTSKPNSVLLSTTGVSFVGHSHVANDITDFNLRVNSLVKQDLRYLNNTRSNSSAGTFIHLTGNNELNIPLETNKKYVCELGIIMSGNNSNITGTVSTTGTRGNNYSLLAINGTWNYLSGENPLTYNNNTSLTGQALIGHNINGVHTLVNKFSVKTYATEPDQISLSFTSNDTNGTILEGSWLKVEEVI